MALDLIHLLRRNGADVAYHDPYVPRIDADGLAMERSPLERATLERSDCVVIATPRSAYEWERVVDTQRHEGGGGGNPGRVVRL